jgi:hypothetical protein
MLFSAPPPERVKKVLHTAQRAGVREGRCFVLFRHNKVQILMQKIHTLSDN